MTKSGVLRTKYLVPFWAELSLKLYTNYYKKCRKLVSSLVSGVWESLLAPLEGFQLLVRVLDDTFSLVWNSKFCHI